MLDLLRFLIRPEHSSDLCLGQLVSVQTLPTAGRLMLVQGACSSKRLPSLAASACNCIRGHRDVESGLRAECKFCFSRSG